MILRSHLLSIVCGALVVVRVVFGSASVGVAADGSAVESVSPAAGYEEVAQRLRELIEREIGDKDVPAFSIALVDGEKTVWAEGFGFADRQRQVPATASTVYRVGSVSKLFTDVAIMQLVELGKLSLDAPVTDYLPDFAPQSAFDVPITLRQLMSHRSGLVREPPVGHYFDPNEPSLGETVASLNETAIVYEPGTKTKYSNAGIAVVGYVLEQTMHVPFAQRMEEAVLRPLGMEDSSFRRTPSVDANLADAWMWTYDGRRFDAPEFGLGTAPAGNLYSSVLDLAKLIQAIFRGGEGEQGRVLEEATLEEMISPRRADSDERTRFGIGFHITELDGHTKVGHGGAVYGFSTQLEALPEEQLGVVAVATLDGSNGLVDRIANHALRLMLARRAGDPLPEAETTEPVPPEIAREVAGRYAGEERQIELSEDNGRLYLRRGSFRYALGARDDALVVDDVLLYGPEIEREGPDTLLLGQTRYVRQPDGRPDHPPARWRGLIGEYGWDHNTLYILEDRGQLVALIEWFYYYPLEELSENEFAFPDYGLYHGEKLVFNRDANGVAAEVVAAGIPFRRRDVGTSAGETFRIDPIKPIEELREAARNADPPAEKGDFRDSDFVELTNLDPTIRLDIRYATTNNFMGAVFYNEPRAFMQRPAAEAVIRAHKRLEEHGYGLLIHDAYRPWYVTKMFWDATPEHLKHFVANPAAGSRHNRGCAVDLTLYELDTGRPVEMVAGYDEFSPRSYPAYPGGTARQRWHRELLRDTMEAEDFTIYEHEWWHFDYKDWREYRIGNVTFEEILGRQ